MTVITSASGLLAMLEEEEPLLKLHALKNLNLLVDLFWAEISASISSIESLYEDEQFEHRELAALVASKVFYHLGELSDSLTYALGAGSLFNLDEGSEYVHTLTAKCIDAYTEISVKRAEDGDGAEDVALDPRLVAIVERMLDSCIASGQYAHAIGVALECRRLDKLEEAVRHSGYSPQLLAYCLRVSHSLVNRRLFRQQVLRTLVGLFEQAETPDYVSICQCLMFLDDAPAVATIMDKLLKEGGKSSLLAYQIAFDLFESEFQQFLLNVRNLLPDITPAPPPPPPVPAAAAPASAAPSAPAAAAAPASTAEAGSEAASATAGDQSMADGEAPDAAGAAKQVEVKAEDGAAADDPAAAVKTEGGEAAAAEGVAEAKVEVKAEPVTVDAMETEGDTTDKKPAAADGAGAAAAAEEKASADAEVKEDDNSNTAAAAATTAAPDTVTPVAATTAAPDAAAEAAAAAERAKAAATAAYGERLARVKGILSGETPISLTLQFLFTHNKADVAILKGIKSAVETRNSVCHSATIFANAIMHAGTTVDTFLRDNLDWLSRATNWAKFSATAGLGVIHKGHLQQGRSLMAPYLPPQAGGSGSSSGSPFSEGGALYALGLIHANHGETIRNFLLESLRNASNETIQHGACLGLGLAALGTGDEEAFEDVKSVLYTDSAVAGEAAGIAMGLLMVGSASEKAGEMLAYAHDTQHEKIIRGLGLGVALVVYGREEEADTLIEQMCRDQDPILRYGGMYAIAMAYRGTANNNAIRRLLHFAVSDVSDDVRRAAVLALGFVLCSEPEQMPRIVSLLAESYNPHVRYGAAMAVGVACAGTALRGAVDLLEPLLSDTVDFVRQGALLAMAMVLMQCSEERESRVGSFRKQLDKIVHDKHEDTMAKMGAILASGIIDAGGRNVTISLRSRSGYDRLTATVGMAVFTQSWYWYPLTYFISLSFSATAFVGLNQDLHVPKMTLISDCRPSLFAYPAPVAAHVSSKASKAPVAVLSTAARAKGRARRAEAEGKGKGEAGKTGGVKIEEKGKGVEKGGEEKGPAAMAVDGAGKSAAGEEGSSAAAAADGDAMPVDTTASGATGTSTAAEKDKDKEKEKAKEATRSEILHNPTRVLPAQEKYVKFPPDSRYVPIRKAASGFVVLLDKHPEQPEELALADGSASSAATSGAHGHSHAATPASATARGAAAMAEDEPPPPEEFEFTN